VRLRHSGAILGLILVCSIAAAAKDQPLSAIILYETPNGPAYVQANTILLNGKNEVYACADNTPLDNNAYKRLGKMKLDQAQAIERGTDGVLTMTTAGGKSCIVPQNLKLEKKTTLTPSQMADQAVISGRFISKSTNGADLVPSEFKIGTLIKFVPAADDELAEYLRVTRKAPQPLLGEYLTKYPSAPHTLEVKNILAGMIVTDGENALATYKKSVEMKAPDYKQLRVAREKANEARKVVPSFIRAEKLLFETDSLTQNILQAGRSAMTEFAKAISERTAGYEHLKQAFQQAENARVVDPGFPNLEKLRADIDTQQGLIDRATDQAEGLVKEEKFDQAFATIQRWASFASELPRISAVIDASAKSHREKGESLAKEQRLEEAILEFRRSLEFKQDPVTESALKAVENELNTAKNKIAAQEAVNDAETLAASKQFIEAYEKLLALPDGQRAFVTEELDKLRPEYLQDLVTRSNDLTRVHIPIRGRADEDAVRTSYDYLTKASKLSDDDTIKVKLDLVSEKISEYYLQLATKQLEKPRGSGASLGYQLLLEGQRFRRDYEDLRNALTKYNPAYNTRAKLSIAVQFRDQTSRRDSLGFADQMADTIASRLEQAGFLGINILTRDRIPNPIDANQAQPNFQLIGDIMQHRVDKKIDTQRLTSKYRAGTREVRNPAWLEQKRLVDAAERDYQQAVENSRTVALRNKKREIQEANALVDSHSKSVEAQKRKLEAIPEMLLENIIQPYNYTKRVYTLDALVEVNFRAGDTNAQASPQNDNVKVEKPKSAHVLENVKPEDTEGVVEEGNPPDEIQLLAEAEAETQGQLVGKLTQWLQAVPSRVLEDARASVSRGDKDAAAERYILYMNITPEKETAERTEAMNFLRGEYNLTSLKTN